MFSNRFLFLFLLFCIFSNYFIIDAQFNIPLPFGNVQIGKNEKGELELGANQNFQLFGWGGKRDFKLTTGNGTFKIDKSDTALLNGSNYGTAGSFGIDESKGIDIGQNLTLQNKTLVGGLGKETNFLDDLLSLFKKPTPS